EDSLGRMKESAEAVPLARINEILQLLDGVGSRLSSLDPATPPERSVSPRRHGEEPLETVRVELDEMDALVESVTETTIQMLALDADLEVLSRIRKLVARLPAEIDRTRRGDRGDGIDARVQILAAEIETSLAAAQRTLGSRAGQASRELTQVREKADRLRLLPASVMFAPLERAVRDAAQTLGKRVELRAMGGDQRLDAHVLVSLRDALLHLVRNAVAHGIEDETGRRSSGKDPVGKLEISVERRGARLAFTCRDDGQGIDVRAIRRAAIERGMIPASQADSLTMEEATRLLLEGGFTTTTSVSEVSGRGIGLDVVRETATRLRGDIDIRTEAGRGTSVEITVPVSLSSLPAMLLEASGVTAALPLDAVPAALRLRDEDVARSPEAAKMLHAGESIPLTALSAILDPGGDSARNRGARSVVIVRSGDRRAALEVDRVIGTANLVVRRLPPWLRTDAVVAGAALDPRGLPQLVLDPEGIVQAAGTRPPRFAEKIDARLPVLVVDDSLTTRMLEQSILESAGYQVDLAASAEEALGKAREKKYVVFLVDVEMPGMDGFEFIRRTKADPRLSATPAILVTSRGSAEDRKRGEEAGASAYVVKSEFDQKRLLQTIAELVG
ncbi:MAG TPA: response regulator, partial [Vicinamibacteria bacterium]